MARASSSQAGPADLPQLVERLHSDGSAAVDDFLQEELETVIDDLPLALESESIRDHLPALVGRIETRLERTFRRIIEIARQDEERSGLLVRALRELRWRGTPTEDEFAWLVQQMSRHPDAASRLAAYERASHLTLHAAQVAILDALGSIHPDPAIREADRRRREDAAAPGAEKPAETTAELVSAAEAARRADMAPEPEPQPQPDPPPSEAEEPTPMTAAADLAEPTQPGLTPASAGAGSPPPVLSAWEDPGETAVSAAPPAPENEATPLAAEPPPSEAVYDESQAEDETWKQKEEPPPDKLTVRTLLRSLEAPPVENLAKPAEEARGSSGNGNGHDHDAPAVDDEPTVADDEEPTPHVENSLSEEPTAPPQEPVADESSSPEAAAAAAAEEPKKDPITVRTLLASLDTVLLTNSPDESASPPPPEEKPEEVWNEAENPPERVTVMTMLRSLETVRVKMQALEDTPAVPEDAPAPENGREASPAAPPQPEPERPKPEPKPWSDVDLKPLSPPERARRLAKVRRELKTPELRRGYLQWLLDREKDSFSVVSIRKEILEFAFERGTFLGFDPATRARMGRWIRERAAADQVAPAAVLAALRRATWLEGEPPQVDDETRPIVDAATGALSRVPSEERAALFNRDFTAWLFSIREWEDREVLDRYARDPHPGVSEGLFRALAAMDGLSARFGGTGGESALQIALGLWDRADNDARTEMAKAIAAGWSRGLVLDRRAFFEAFWARHQQHEAQRPAILIALASFEKEIEEAKAKAGGPKPTPAPAPAPAPSPSPTATFAPPPRDEPPRPPITRVQDLAPVAESDEKAATAPPPKPAPAAASERPKPRPTRPPMPAPKPAAEAPAKQEPAPAPRPVAAKEVTRGNLKSPPVEPAPARPVEPAPAPSRETPARGTPRPAKEVVKVPGERRSSAPPPTRAADPPVIETTAKTPPPAQEAAPAEDRTRRTVMPPVEAEPPDLSRISATPEKPKSLEANPDVDEGTDRFFRMMRKNMEAGMRAAVPAAKPAEEPSAPPDDIDAPVPEEGEAVDGVLPEEGDAVLEPSGPKAAPAAPPAAAAPKSGDTRDDEVVLPAEPLRTLADYTRFLKALSAGRPIDELLSNHGMDYKQYAACMTAWGKLLQSRPDLALRMGQLLRGPA